MPASRRRCSHTRRGGRGHAGVVGERDRQRVAGLARCRDGDRSREVVRAAARRGRIVPDGIARRAGAARLGRREATCRVPGGICRVGRKVHAGDGDRERVRVGDREDDVTVAAGVHDIGGRRCGYRRDGQVGHGRRLGLTARTSGEPDGPIRRRVGAASCEQGTDHRADHLRLAGPPGSGPAALATGMKRATRASRTCHRHHGPPVPSLEALLLDALALEMSTGFLGP